MTSPSFAKMHILSTFVFGDTTGPAKVPASTAVAVLVWRRGREVDEEQRRLGHQLLELGKEMSHIIFDNL